MPAASILIKPASANCNIDCRYCFYKCLSSRREEYSRGFMSEETLEKLVVNAMDYADGYLCFAFQGGEPMLAGMEFFQKVTELQEKYNHKHLQIENTIQTNGMLIDDAWGKFFSEHHFLVGISLDGPKKIHDQYRKDAGGNGTFDRVRNAISILEKYHVDFNILCVVTEDTAGKASYLYRFFKRNHISYLQLIPCMDEQGRNTEAACEMEKKERNAFALTPESYGKFLCELFDLWYEDFRKGEAIDIRMFSNLAQMAAGYPAEECGMNGFCGCYFVVEGDGSVYPCDFYCMDEYRLGDVGTSFSELRDSKRAKDFVEVSHSVSPECGNCPQYDLCRGGCRRWREPFVDGKPGRNQLCGAYQVFFGYAGERIKELGEIIVNAYGKPVK